MHGRNPDKRTTEAIESIARSAQRIAVSAEAIAKSEREKTGFLSRFLAFCKGTDGSTQEKVRKFGDGGGIGGTAKPKIPLGPNPAGGLALPGDRPCINVTPLDQKTKRKG